MDRGKRSGIFYPQSRQGVNVEKSAVVDVTSGQSPICEPIVLALEQMMQGEQGSRFA